MSVCLSFPEGSRRVDSYDHSYTVLLALVQVHSLTPATLIRDHIPPSFFISVARTIFEGVLPSLRRPATKTIGFWYYHGNTEHFFTLIEANEMLTEPAAHDFSITAQGVLKISIYSKATLPPSTTLKAPEHVLEGAVQFDVPADALLQPSPLRIQIIPACVGVILKFLLAMKLKAMLWVAL